MAKDKEEKKVVPASQFEIGGKKYKFNVYEFRIDGKTIKASEALKDAEMLEGLVKIKAGVIEEVKGKEEK
jgi:hypothetical protein